MRCHTADSQAFDSEMPQHEVTLGGYWIGRYPVTNAEYWKFIEGGGYQTQWCWTEAGWKWKGDRIQPAYWGDEDYNDSQQPVVGVSWYEAVAYCRWLGGKTGLPMRLPSEAEWEKAARGIDGRIYPWGDECDVSKCNVSETGIGKAAPVGKFSPQGDSPYGCTDMIGNVWEWTSTLYADCPYQSDDRREDPEAGGFRVRRGGCFFDDVRSARAACRHASLPNSCREYFGFRVVCGAFPISPRSGS
jgi:formylglycine-generating enzyme required for sulfatase activity